MRRRRAGRLRQDRSSRRWPSAHTGGRSPTEDVNELLAVLPATARRTAASKAASAARSPACWRARSSCIAASTFRRDCAPGDTYAINDLELASKLSFFLWNTIPDDELLQLAINGKLERAGRARPAGAAHAGRSAFDHAGEQFRPSMARHEAAGRDRAGLGGVPVCVRPMRSARRLPHRADAVRRQHLQGRPQRRRSADARSTRFSTSASRCTTASPT